jgi:hypothetical protein
VPDHQLPPSRFVAGHTVGGAPIHPMTAISRQPTSPGLDLPVRPPTAATAAPLNKLAVLSFVLVVFLGPLAGPGHRAYRAGGAAAMRKLRWTWWGTCKGRGVHRVGVSRPRRALNKAVLGLAAAWGTGRGEWRAVGR